MDIRKEILKEHNKAQTMKLVDYVGDNPHRFESLVTVFLQGPYRITQRASWSLAYCVEAHPQLIRPHLKTILNHLKKSAIHDSVKRNTIRLLQFIEIPKRLQGQVVDTCFQFLSSKKEPVAVHVFSMAVLVNMARHNPELIHELIVVIEDHLPFAKPAFTSRAQKALKELKQAS
jgi:hypothetical protein